jgi:autotransporter-associated beta strand protein
LAAASPLVTVLGSPVTINTPVLGTTGLHKAGPGRLVLTGVNNLSGTTAVDAGVLAEGNLILSASSPTAISAGAILESFAALSIQVNSSSTTLGASGAGTLRLTATTNSPDSPDLYFGPNHVANTDWGARLATALDLGDQQRFIFGKTGHNGVGPYGLTGADCQFAGPIFGSAGLTIIAQNNWTGSDPMEVSFALNAANTFSGPVEIRRGSLYLGNVNALTRDNVLSFNPGSGNKVREITPDYSSTDTMLRFQICRPREMVMH